jgi:hypothetical protein
MNETEAFAISLGRDLPWTTPPREGEPLPRPSDFQSKE